MTKHRHTRESIEKAVADSKSWAQVCRKLGIPPATGSQTHLTRKTKALGISIAHFTGKGWNKGRKFGFKRPISDYLSNAAPIKANALKKRLIKEGIKKALCEICGQDSWRGRPIPLELDHINSNHWDNRLENLQIICPSCHYQETMDRHKPSQRTPSGERVDLGSTEAKADGGSIPPAGTTIKKTPKPKRVKRVVLCKDCGKQTSGTPRCKRCSVVARTVTKIVWPSQEELSVLVTQNPTSHVSKLLGVSDVAVAKRCRKLGIKKPPRGAWAKHRAKTAKDYSD